MERPPDDGNTQLGRTTRQPPSPGAENSKNVLRILGPSTDSWVKFSGENYIAHELRNNIWPQIGSKRGVSCGQQKYNNSSPATIMPESAARVIRSSSLMVLALELHLLEYTSTLYHDIYLRRERRRHVRERARTHAAVRARHITNTHR